MSWGKGEETDILIFLLLSTEWNHGLMVISDHFYYRIWDPEEKNFPPFSKYHKQTSKLFQQMSFNNKVFDIICFVSLKYVYFLS